MDVPRTTNSNGIFVNLSVLGETEIAMIYEFVSNIKDDISHIDTFDTYVDNDTTGLMPPPIATENNGPLSPLGPNGKGPNGKGLKGLKGPKGPKGPTYPKVKLTALQRTILALS